MRQHPLTGRLAAPSWVLPAGVAANARFLAGKVDEVGLCCFESRACLAYDERDLPPDLAGLPLRWHLHLPVDLPWPARGDDAAPAARMAVAVVQKTGWLRPHLAVLHPPEGSPARQRLLLAAFVRVWQRLQLSGQAPRLALENIAHASVAELDPAFLAEHDLSFCLDVGHMLGYAQHDILDTNLPEQAALLHWSAPGRQDEHLPLTQLTPPQRRTTLELLPRLPGTAVHLAEVFHWQGAALTLAELAALAREAGGADRGTHGLSG